MDSWSKLHATVSDEFAVYERDENNIVSIKTFLHRDYAGALIWWKIEEVIDHMWQMSGNFINVEEKRETSYGLRDIQKRLKLNHQRQGLWMYNFLNDK